ncbi:MAG: hypothetical protein WC159_09170 [Sphaerochaetaceae bacterium]
MGVNLEKLNSHGHSKTKRCPCQGTVKCIDTLGPGRSCGLRMARRDHTGEKGMGRFASKGTNFSGVGLNQKNKPLFFRERKFQRSRE